MLSILNSDIRIRLAVSFDGIGENHDRIRNTEGAHRSAMKTVNDLKCIKDSRLIIQANVAISPYNIEQLETMLLYFNTKVNKISWFPVIVSERNFKNDEKADNLIFNLMTKKN